MRCQCVICGILYDVKEPFDNDQVSHGYCELCWPWVQNNLRIELEQLGLEPISLDSNHFSGERPNLTPRNRSSVLTEGPSDPDGRMSEGLTRSLSLTGQGHGGVREP